MSLDDNCLVCTGMITLFMESMNLGYMCSL